MLAIIQWYTWYIFKKLPLKGQRFTNFLGKCFEIFVLQENTGNPPMIKKFWTRQLPSRNFSTWVNPRFRGVRHYVRISLTNLNNSLSHQWRKIGIYTTDIPEGLKFCLGWSDLLVNTMGFTLKVPAGFIPVCILI